jgi:hypothetical protein
MADAIDIDISETSLRHTRELQRKSACKTSISTGSRWHS